MVQNTVQNEKVALHNDDLEQSFSFKPGKLSIAIYFNIIIPILVISIIKPDIFELWTYPLEFALGVYNIHLSKGLFSALVLLILSFSYWSWYLIFKIESHDRKRNISEKGEF